MKMRENLWVVLFLTYGTLFADESKSPKVYEDVTISRVVNVYDGDTFHVDIDHFPPIIGQRMAIRVNGIDAPEIRTSDPEEKKKAIIARDFAKQLLTEAKVIILKNLKRCKYFRIVADVLLVNENENKDLASELLKSGHAVPYNKAKRLKLFAM